LKALAQNLSDIAAMGGTPTHAVIAIALPPRWTPDDAAALYRGIADLARQSATDIIGGDTVRSTGPLTISVTILGTVPPDELLTRSGAKSGDALFVTGTLGRAAAGLHLLETGQPAPPALLPAIRAQMQPEPRLIAARALAASGQVTAMMDVSDGVASDLHRLCRRSNVGAIIECDLLPIDPLVPVTCTWLSTRGDILDPVTLALTGGEDFELLLTAPACAEAALRHAVAPLPLTRIGAMTTKPEILLQSGADRAPLGWGYTHF